MKILGLQRLSLLDYPGKLACTIFTGGCNLRCPFCHNAPLVTEIRNGEIPDDEILDFLKSRKGRLDGVCVSGGEPLIQPDIEDFISKIKDIGYSVKLDTNGTSPDKLKFLIKSKLVDYVAMDIKNSPQKYAQTVGKSNFDIVPVQKSVSLLMENKVNYEFRTTVTKTFHTEEDLLKIGKWLSGAEKYYLQAFVDSGNIIDPDVVGYDKKTLVHFCNLLKPYFKIVELRGV